MCSVRAFRILEDPTVIQLPAFRLLRSENINGISQYFLFFFIFFYQYGANRANLVARPGDGHSLLLCATRLRLNFMLAAHRDLGNDFG